MLKSSLPCQYFVSTENGFAFKDTYKLNMEIPEECPNCGKTLYPNHLVSLAVNNLSSYNPIASIFFCHACGQFIFTLTINYDDINIISRMYPPAIENRIISKSIESLSPDFVRIFNQAATAEKSGLDEICGMGYRKALEFLIKDFSIYRHPDDKEAIEKMPLGACINTYCENEKIKTLAKASARRTGFSFVPLPLLKITDINSSE